MRADYTQILELVRGHPGIPDKYTRHVEKILLDTEQQFPEVVLSETEPGGVEGLVNLVLGRVIRDAMLKALTESLNNAINIVLFKAGFETHFEEIENDKGEGIKIGERIEDPAYKGVVKLRITALDIVNLESTS